MSGLTLKKMVETPVKSIVLYASSFQMVSGYVTTQSAVAPAHMKPSM